MPKIDRTALLFSVNCYAAAALALGIGFAIDLQRPYWAVMTVYIISQPLAGAVRSKAVYRVFGTLLGAAFAVLTVPILINSPLLLSFALAAWVGVCLGVSLLDRSPRAYTLMLAGYTATLIAFPTVSRPDQVFDVAVSRVEEIVLGILCATVTHSLFFPRPVGVILHMRLASWLSTADNWALALLRRQDREKIVADRRDLATAATEIHMLSLLLPFDVSAVRPLRTLVQAAHERFLMLIPLLSSIGDRLTALAALPGGIDPSTAELLRRMGDWVAAGADSKPAMALAQEIETRNQATRSADWAALLRVSLLSRLVDLLTELSAAHRLLAQDIHAPEIAHDIHVPSKPPRLHRDPGLAAISGLSATITIMLVSSLWITTGWADGATAAALAGVFCALFATLDDPAPAIVGFGVFALLSIAVAAFYLFAILAGTDGFAALIIFLAPPLLVAGYLMPDRRTALPGLAFAIGLASSLALQETYAADFAAFVNSNISLYVGLFTALMVTRGMRSLSLDAALGRLFRRNWAQLAALARQRRHLEIEQIAAEMVDRLGLIAPRLANNDGTPLPVRDPLAEIRIGMNLAQIDAFRASLPADKAERIALLLQTIGAYFATLAAGRKAPPPEAVLRPLDHCLSVALASEMQSDLRRKTLAAFVGLRRNMFPDAPVFIPEVSS